jgi:uncharacterized cupin superfamily protein
MPEARFDETENGRVAEGDGWFVLNARDAIWRDGPGRFANLERRGGFPQLGVSLYSLQPGEPMAQYHWETDQEDFLVISGEATLVIEDEERPLRTWDFVHCPPGTRHVIVGAGAGACVIFGVGAREKHVLVHEDGRLEGRDDWGAYTVSEAAIRLGAGVEQETADAAEAYKDWPQRVSSPYRDGWLPD